MKRSLYSIGAIVIMAWLPPMAAGGQLPQDQGTVLLVEAPHLFRTSLTDGKLRRVPHAGPIYLVGGLSDSSTFLIKTKDEEGRIIFEKISERGELKARYPAPVGAVHSSFSPDGKQYLYANTDWNLILHDIEAHTSRKLFEPDRGESVAHPTLSPDRTTVAFSLTPREATRVSSRLCLMQVDQQLQRDRCVGERVIFPSFSSDGTKLAYWEQTKQFPDHNWSLIVREISANGKLGALTIVLSQKFEREFDDVRIGPIGWSPDSEWLMWSLRSDRSSPFFGLFRTRIATGETQEVPIKRSWWTTFWREYLLPSDKNRFAFNFQWMP